MEISLPEFALVTVNRSKQSSPFVDLNFKQEELFSLNDLEKKLPERLEQGKLSVILFDELEQLPFQLLSKFAKKYHVLLVAIFLTEQPLENLSEVENHLKQKGFKKIYVTQNPNLLIERYEFANNQKSVHGPFDLIGDVHGCYDELCELLEKLGYEVNRESYEVYSPENRILVFLGDLVDRGPKITEVLKLVMNLVKQKKAYCVLGNHEGKLQRKLAGANVKVIHGLEVTLEQLEKEPETFIQALKQFLEGLVSHYVFDEGQLVVAHAGLKEKLHGKESPKIRDLAMFGETTGKLDELGLPVRLQWHKGYRGKAFVVYGHTPQAQAQIINQTINIDTGCVFGGKLTAFRYPEQEIVEVKAKETYSESIRPFL